MFNFNLKQIRETVTVKADGRVLVDYFFDFADGAYGMLVADTGSMIIHRTINQA